MKQNKLDVCSVRLVKDAPLMSETPILEAVDAIKAVANVLSEMDREVLCVINMKTNGVPINCTFASMGGLNEALASPREMLKASILSNAASMIIVHNHPSSSLKPSKEDTMITDRMMKLCNLVGIPLLDHVIIGDNTEEYFSFRSKNVLPIPRNRYEKDYNNLQFPESAVAEEKQSISKHNHR